jgi:hypothetical protein
MSWRDGSIKIPQNIHFLLPKKKKKILSVKEDTPFSWLEIMTSFCTSALIYNLRHVHCQWDKDPFFVWYGSIWYCTISETFNNNTQYMLCNMIFFICSFEIDIYTQLAEWLLSYTLIFCIITYIYMLFIYNILHWSYISMTK